MLSVNARLSFVVAGWAFRACDGLVDFSGILDCFMTDLASFSCTWWSGVHLVILAFLLAHAVHISWLWFLSREKTLCKLAVTENDFPVFWINERY